MQLKDAETLIEFECSASFTQHAKTYPAFLRLKFNELTWTIRGTDITSRREITKKNTTLLESDPSVHI